MLLVLGGFTYWGGSLQPPVPGQQVGPDVFPMVIGAGLVFCGLLIAFGIGQGDEIDLAQKHISYRSPLGLALLKRKVGDAVVFKKPSGEAELTILSIRYE